LHKVHAFIELLRRNQIPMKGSKRLPHLLRAIVDFRASSATFYSRLVGKALERLGAERFRQLMLPLVDDLTDAVRLLREDGRR
jgi:hypothetical protein